MEVIECFITNLNTDERVLFNIEAPQEVSESYSASFEDQVTRGRSSPFKAYTNSGPRSISFTVTLALDFRRDLAETVDCLRDMFKPQRGVYIMPPRVKVKIGNILDIKAAPISFDALWSNGMKDGVYRTCECTFAFDEVEDVGSFTKKHFTETPTAVIIVDAPEAIPRESGVTNSPRISYPVTYEYGAKYSVFEEITGYYTADEALSGRSIGNPTSKVKPGEYFIYTKAKGAINISESPDSPGSWIKP